MIEITHGGFHLGNIIISTGTSPRILAIIDWAHAGWYPDCWEYCKALYTANHNDVWRTVWIPEFLDQLTPEFNAFAEYILQIGVV